MQLGKGSATCIQAHTHIKTYKTHKHAHTGKAQLHHRHHITHELVDYLLPIVLHLSFGSSGCRCGAVVTAAATAASDVHPHRLEGSACKYL